MYRPHENSRICFRCVFLLIILFFCDFADAQTGTEKDTVFRRNNSFLPVNEKSFYIRDSTLPDKVSLIPPNNSLKNKDLAFYNSLKQKASKRVLTKKLYEFIVVNPAQSNPKKITAGSDAGYLEHSGKIIRSITVRKVDVFGGNINNPGASQPRKIEEVLNRTHFSTTEKIIRKNLLFSVNDTVSPLVLSDNERILRQLSYINDARIVVIPVSEYEADILVLTRDVYSIGGSADLNGLKKGTAGLFDKNIFGIGHELGIDVPFDSEKTNSPGLGFHYIADNIGKSFINLNLKYSGGLGEQTYGLSLTRNLVSSSTKYAGGASVIHMYTTEDLDSMLVPEPLKYNYQDYWLSRSFLLNRISVSRFIIGTRYINNNIFAKPEIFPNSYHKLQRYRMFLGSVAFSIQKYYKTNLIYGYGTTEDIPYGGLFKITAGKELNEFKERTYIGTELSFGKSRPEFGYFYGSVSAGSYFNQGKTEQGLLSFNLKYFSNLVYIGNHMIRNFVYADYSRGFDRYTDEFLFFKYENGLSAFRNDSVNGRQRLMVSLESVLFSPLNFYGFRFAFFGFTDFSLLSGSINAISDNSLAGIGLGIRIRNDNMVFKTIQVRFTYFPDLPVYSSINPLTISGEQLLKPNNFDSGPPSIIRFQ